MKWYYISTKKATFLIGANDIGLVVETAPIAARSKMRKIEDVLNFYRNRFNAYIKYLGEDTK